MATKRCKSIFCCLFPLFQRWKKKKNRKNKKPAEIPVDEQIPTEVNVIVEQKSNAGPKNNLQDEKPSQLLEETSQSLFVDCREEPLEYEEDVFCSVKSGDSSEKMETLETSSGESETSESLYGDDEKESSKFLTAGNAENPPEQEAQPLVPGYPAGIPVVYEDPSKNFHAWKKLGAGGFGTVFKVKTQNSRTPVALKTAEIKKRDTGEIRELEEINILKKLAGHRNIVKLYSTMIYVTPKRSQLWFTMEYCRGGSLSQLIERAMDNSLPEKCIQYISKEVLEGLNYMHKNRIVHRDIKSQNITLNRHGAVKIIDFGLAVQLKRPDDHIRGLAGTTHWMAPEVLGCRYDREEKYNFKCDIWSFGITLIEMAQGQPPYYEMSRLNTIINITTGDPPRLTYENIWSKDFVDFLGQCLIKSPEQRPTATQLLDHPFIKEQPEADCVKSSLKEYAKTFG